MKNIGVAILFLVLGPLSSGQEGSVPRVLIPLIVTDHHRRLVSDLQTASLTIREGRTAVTQVSVLRGLDLPLELGVMIDTSRSERDYGNINDLIAQAKDFASAVVRGPEDRVFFLTFADKTQSTGWLKREQVAGVSLNVKLGGGTALYDSLAIACRERMGPRDWNRPTRRVLVVISDGEDNLSRLTLGQAVSEALTSGAVILAVKTSLLGSSRRASRVLEYWTTTAGGAFFGDFTRQEIPKIFSRIKEITEGIYYASYAPPLSNDRVHEVEIRPTPKEKLEISYPRKYLWVE